MDSPAAAWNTLDDAALRAGVVAAFAREPAAVTRKRLIPPSGDRHDYISFAPYSWPNPDTPDGLPYVTRDGEVNPQSRVDTDRGRVIQIADDAQVMAAAAIRLGDSAAGREAARRLRIFFLDGATAMRPHLEYGQGIPGNCDGRCFGIIETGILANRLVDAILLLHAAGHLPDGDLAALRGWFSAYLDWLVTSDKGRAESERTNNHGVSWDLQAATFAAFSGRDSLALETLRAVPGRRIARQIEPDGRQPRELGRTRTMSYSTMNVGYFCELALLGERLGVDLWGYESPDGRSIPRAIDWLLPYWDGEKPWEYPQIVPFDPSATLVPRAVRRHFQERHG